MARTIAAITPRYTIVTDGVILPLPLLLSATRITITLSVQLTNTLFISVSTITNATDALPVANETNMNQYT